jgi:hypothetical protein
MGGRPMKPFAARLVLVVALAACELGVPGPGGRGALGVALARADESWSEEFAQVCAKTQDAMSFTDAELRALVERCDVLKPVVDKLDEPRRKVYSRRLQACRGLYQFVLDSRTR